MSRKHIIFLDGLEKLSLSKDSSLHIAISLKMQNEDCFLLFEEDFYYINTGKIMFSMYEFDGVINRDSYYIENFVLKSKRKYELNKSDIIHMRIDPPFDTKYLRFNWMLKSIQKKIGLTIINDPAGIINFNEKLFAYENTNEVSSYVGSSVNSFETFCLDLIDKDFTNIVLKPLDLYQGIGVEKVSLENLDLSKSRFIKKVKKYNGSIVVQPFLKEIEDGEVRSIFYDNELIGSIIKTPPNGGFISNIASGATYEPYYLSKALELKCKKFTKELEKYQTPWVAFDILDGVVQEVNITCPGLLVEVSSANNINLSNKIIDLILKDSR